MLKAVITLGGGGGGGGVTSLNGETGDITLTSTGNTITITPSGQTINLEATGGGTGPQGPEESVQLKEGSNFQGYEGFKFDPISGDFLIYSPNGTQWAVGILDTGALITGAVAFPPGTLMGIMGLTYP